MTITINGVERELLDYSTKSKRWKTSITNFDTIRRHTRLVMDLNEIYILRLSDVLYFRDVPHPLPVELKQDASCKNSMVARYDDGTEDICTVQILPHDEAARLLVQARSVDSPQTPSPSDMLSIEEAAAYAGVSTRTIRNWINAKNPDDSPMLAGVEGTLRKRRIPRSSLTPYCKDQKHLEKPST